LTYKLTHELVALRLIGFGVPVAKRSVRKIQGLKS